MNTNYATPTIANPDSPTYKTDISPHARSERHPAAKSGMRSTHTSEQLGSVSVYDRTPRGMAIQMLTVYAHRSLPPCLLPPTDNYTVSEIEMAIFLVDLSMSELPCISETVATPSLEGRDPYSGPDCVDFGHEPGSSSYYNASDRKDASRQQTNLLDQSTSNALQAPSPLKYTRTSALTGAIPKPDRRNRAMKRVPNAVARTSSLRLIMPKPSCGNNSSSSDRSAKRTDMFIDPSVRATSFDSVHLEVSKNTEYFALMSISRKMRIYVFTKGGEWHKFRSPFIKIISATTVGYRSEANEVTIAVALLLERYFDWFLEQNKEKYTDKRTLLHGVVDRFNPVSLFAGYLHRNGKSLATLSPRGSTRAGRERQDRDVTTNMAEDINIFRRMGNDGAHNCIVGAMTEFFDFMESSAYPSAYAVR